jgi:hypothetical protein
MKTMKAASLTSSLLATKGEASPAGFLAPADLSLPFVHSGMRPTLVPAPAGSSGGGPKARKRGAAPSTSDRMRQVHISFRIDPQRHLRLKLVAAHRKQSLRDCLIEAVDLYLDGIAPTVRDGRCDCLAAQDEPSPPSSAAGGSS